MKNTFASDFYKSDFYASGYFRGLGVDIADIRGWVVLHSRETASVSLSSAVVTSVSLRSQPITPPGE